MRRLTILLLLLICAVSSATAEDPSPQLNQLSIGAIAYGGSSIWTSSGQGAAYTAANRIWFANRYSYAIGSGSSASDIASLKAINPSMWVTYYRLAAIRGGDTTAFKTWCANSSLHGGVVYNPDSIWIRAGSAAGDSVGLKRDGVVKHTVPGGIVTYWPYAPVACTWTRSGSTVTIYRNSHTVKAGDSVAVTVTNDASALPVKTYYVNSVPTSGSMTVTGLMLVSHRVVLPLSNCTLSL